MGTVCNSRPGGGPFDPAAISDPRLCKLYTYWSERAAGCLPGYRDVDAIEMRFVLGNLTLVDVERPGAAAEKNRTKGDLVFRFRLAAQSMEYLYGCSMTGLRADELDVGAFKAELLSSYEQAVASASPVLTAGRSDYRSGLVIDYERLILPLAADGRRVDMLLVGATFSLVRGRNAAEARILNLSG